VHLRATQLPELEQVGADGPRVRVRRQRPRDRGARSAALRGQGPDHLDPELNPTYAELGRHYDVAIIPARPSVTSAAASQSNSSTNSSVVVPKVRMALSTSRPRCTRMRRLDEVSPC